MDSDNNDLLMFSICVSLFGLLVMGAFFSGKWYERRAYTAAFVAQVEAAYFDGYNDCLLGLHKSSK